jgi:protein-disulfide isomerase
MEKMAELIGLDKNVFSNCLADNTHTDKLEQDVENGTVEGIPGTPSVILNGNLLDSFQFADIQAAIENILSDVEGED